ncbi:STAS domain-containing protein [Actinoplanes sp. NPDC049681]|uniref:STAS domain-containing protein n=1 Tax=Actinoplanes sp. NPDC049681 TaxID=3363905 RepID=UPI0037BCB683
MKRNVFWSTVLQGLDDDLTVTVVTAADGRDLTIKLCGSIDLQSRLTLNETLRRVLDTGTAERIVLDLERVGFCDCAGIRALIAAHRHAAARGVRCSIGKPQEHIRWLLGITGAATILDVAGG